MIATQIKDLPTVYDAKETEEKIINFGKMVSTLKLTQKVTNHHIQ